MRLQFYFFLAFFSFFLQSKKLYSQDTQFSQYYAAPTYLNPGLTGINQRGLAGINQRSQWPNVESGFESFSAYLYHHIEDYSSSVGMIFLNDKEGLVGLQSTMLGIQYAYQFQINPKWMIRPGFQASYFTRDLNFHKLTFGDQFDNTGLINPTNEAFDTGLKKSFFDLSSGIIMFSTNLWWGVSVHHMTEPNQSITGSTSPLKRKFSLHGGYRLLLNRERSTNNRERSLTPTFNYRNQAGFEQLDVGMYLLLHPLLTGVWYRGIPIKKQNNIAQNESIIFLVGLKNNRFAFGYSYDYTLSDLGVGTGGTHEISMAYVFKIGNKRKPSRNVRQLRCPIPFGF